MNLQLSRLVQLQQLDLKLHDLEQQQQQIPQRLREMQAPIDQDQKRLEELQRSRKTVASDRRRSEQDLSDHESHLKKKQERLSELKTNKEYQAHLFEIEQARKEKDKLEDKILQCMERDETILKEQEEVQTRLQASTRDMEKEKVELESRGARLTDEIATVEQQKQTLVGTLDKRVYHRYSALKSSLKLVVVAQVRGGTCLGCQLQIPPQLVASVRRSDQLLTCPYCHRILYAEEALHEATESLSTP